MSNSSSINPPIRGAYELRETIEKTLGEMTIFMFRTDDIRVCLEKNGAYVRLQATTIDDNVRITFFRRKVQCRDGSDIVITRGVHNFSGKKAEDTPAFDLEARMVMYGSIIKAWAKAKKPRVLIVRQ